jgi:hypothetical protein
MSDPAVQPSSAAEHTGSGLSQWQRVSSIFSAPSKTFEDIRLGRLSWWLPFLISVFFSYVLFAAITMKVGWKQVAANSVATNPTQMERINQLPPEGRDRALNIAGIFIEVSLAASPAVILIFAALASLILWATINFGFGGKSTYGQIFAVNMYAALPRLFLPLLATIALYAGMAPESFNLSNMAATNAAYFLSVQDTNKALYVLLSQIDVISIWVAVLLSLGIARVAGKKKSAGFITVFGWWGLWVLGRTLVALVMS